MLIGDDDEEDEFAQELKETVKVAMDRLKWSQKLASHDDDERGWSLRQLTPTWVDGHELEPSSIAWSRLVHSTLVAGGLAADHKSFEGPPSNWVKPLNRHRMVEKIDRDLKAASPPSKA